MLLAMVSYWNILLIGTDNIKHTNRYLNTLIITNNYTTVRIC